MTERKEELDFSKVKLFPLKKRPCKVHREDYAKEARKGIQFKEFLENLPAQLKALEFEALLKIWVHAIEEGFPVIALCGAHVLKVGLGPLIIQGMKEKWITHLAFNGAGAVHDFELAYQGATSEDVQKGLEDGSFGMVEETGRFLNQAAKKAQERKIGFGQALADEIEASDAKFPRESVIVAGIRSGVPVTIHVGIGTDIVHQQPTADGAAIGAATYKDFQLFTQSVSELKGGGLVLNFGSAVLLPEVFLKALTVARNLMPGIEGFSTANFDMIYQYRPAYNIVERPTKKGGRGFQFTGHHELMIPLLFQGLAEKLQA